MPLILFFKQMVTKPGRFKKVTIIFFIMNHPLSIIHHLHITPCHFMHPARSQRDPTVFFHQVQPVVLPVEPARDLVRHPQHMASGPVRMHDQ